jgi:predicted dienelactone hydrolase
VIAYAHGFLSSKDEGGDLKTHLASHGYVIVAPDFPLSNAQAPGGPTIVDLANQPGDLAFVVEQVSMQSGEHADLANILDTTHLGVAGLSLGGGTTLISVYHPVLHLPDVQAAVAFAPLSCAFGEAMYVRAVPTLILSGGSDMLVPFDTISARPQEWAPAPLQVANLVGGTHTGFLGIDNPDANNTDELGCSAVQSAIGGSTFDPSAVQPLITQLDAGTNGNIADVAGCGPVCATQYTQTMRGPRQLELTKAATLAHFEAVLRGRADAAAYLTTSLDAQNSDVDVTRLR